MSIGERKGEARTESRVRGGFFLPVTPEGNSGRFWRLFRRVRGVALLRGTSCAQVRVILWLLERYFHDVVDRLQTEKRMYLAPRI